MKFKLLLLSTSILTVIGCSDESSRFKKEYVASCIQMGASKSACHCIYNKLIAKYSVKEMKKYVAEVSINKGLPKAFVQDSQPFALSCLKDN